MDERTVGLVLIAALPFAVVGGAIAWFRRRRRSGGAPSRRQLVAGNLLVLASMLSVAALAGELWLRFGRTATDSFTVMASSERWFARHWRLNVHGYRDDHDHSLGAVLPGTRRVTFVGDSFTTGHGIDDIRGRLANRVRAARPGWDVHLLAQNGWETGDELRFLAEYVPQRTNGAYAYDVVVLAYCLNDAADLTATTDATGAVVKRLREKGALARASDLCDWLRFAWISATDENLRGFFPKIGAAYEGEAWAKQRARLLALRDAVRSRGGTLCVVTWPFLHRLDGGYPFDAAHARLAELWREAGVPHLDLLPVFRGRDASSLVVNGFDAHPNPDANRLAAEALLPFLDDVVAGRAR